MLRSKCADYVPFAVRLLVYLLLALSPLLVVMRHRALPFDDGLRHAAKAVSGKAWSDILVLRTDVTMDQHPGWHAMLAWVHQTLHADQAFLVVLEWLTMFLLVTLCPLPQFRRPEAWCGALLLGMVTAPYHLVFRLSRGRPYLLTMAAMMTLICLWNKRANQRKNAVYLTTVTLIGLSVWVHGAWYLWGLVATAILLGDGWKAAFKFGLCMLFGVLLGGMMTGQPVAYLWQQFHHMLLAFGNGSRAAVLVGEFNPIDNAGPWLLLGVGVVMMYKLVTRSWPQRLLTSPVAMLAAVCWMLGLYVARFWIDWGVPALLLLVAFLIEAMLEQVHDERWIKRIPIALAVGLAVLFAVNADLDGRWSNTEKDTWHTESPLTHTNLGNNPSWMPAPGGLVYSPAMAIFNLLFFEYPHADWRYVYGFEAGIMTAENLAILRTIQLTGHAPKSFAPWVNNMTQKDRMMVFSEAEPTIPGLVWLPIKRGMWSGYTEQ